MARELGQLYVAIHCNECGSHGEGVPAEDGRTRCNKCGQFGKGAENYCTEHDMKYGEQFPGDNKCPICKEEQHRRDLKREAATTDSLYEPW